MSYRVDDDKAKELGLPEQDRILYVLTVEDVEDVYTDYIEDKDNSTPFWDLPEGTRETILDNAHTYIESWAGDSGYTWYDTIMDSLLDN